MKFLELKVPPLALFVVILLLSYWLANSFTLVSFSLPYHQLMIITGYLGQRCHWPFCGMGVQETQNHSKPNQSGQCFIGG